MKPASPSPDRDPEAPRPRLRERIARLRGRVQRMPDLPTVTRVLLIVIGWVLVLIGVAGLVLPGIQGVLTIVVGAAILSLTSRVVLRAMRWTFRPWPRMWRRVLHMRRRVLGWLQRRRGAPEDAGAPEAVATEGQEPGRATDGPPEAL